MFNRMQLMNYQLNNQNNSSHQINQSEYIMAHKNQSLNVQYKMLNAKYIGVIFYYQYFEILPFSNIEIEQEYFLKLRQQKEMNHSIDQFNDNRSFDVVFVGQQASIAANLFIKNVDLSYKCLVVGTQKSVIQPSLLPLLPNQIKIKKSPHKSLYVKDSKILHIKPVAKQIQLQDGKTYEYKYLVYSENDWSDYEAIKTLKQALSNEYSLVYSNFAKHQLGSIYKYNTGNIIFYVPNGRHSGYDNYNFLCVYHKYKQNSKSSKNMKRNTSDSGSPYSSRKVGGSNFNLMEGGLKFKVVLQGNQFFPYCKQADQILKKQLIENGIQIIYNTKITKIDYLRRVLTMNQANQTAYTAFYCYLPQKSSKILESAQIDPYFNNPKTLANKKYKNIFVFGGDIFPTTHTFEAVQHQVHVICKNLQHGLLKSNQTCFYNGKTSIPLYLNNKQLYQMTHYYQSQKRQSNLRLACSRLLYLSAKLSQFSLTEAYYNYSSSGAPYYIFSPHIQSFKLGQCQKYEHSAPMINVKEVDQKQKQFPQENGNIRISK